MQHRHSIRIILGGIAISLFAAGIWHLFALRFRSGDIYQPYSSLRADPLGAKVLYQSLQESGVKVSRSFVPPEKLDADPDTTIFLLGHSAYMGHLYRILDPEETSSLRSFIRNGGRVVITLLPQQTTTSIFNIDDENEDKTTEDSGKSAKPDDKKDPVNPGPAGQLPDKKQKGKDTATKPVITKPGKNKSARRSEEEKKRELQTTANKWLDAEVACTALIGEGLANLSTNAAIPGLPSSISCHTTAHFANPDPEKWNVIYHRRNMPVIIERKFGRGSLVLSTPTYFVSNEAMRNERQTALLMWLMDGRGRALFDEFSHGVTANPNTASLLRAFRMHWFIASLLILALLFVWKNSFSLVPPNEADEDRNHGHRAGKDSLSGLVNLLRRNIDIASILGASVARWKHNLGTKGRLINARKIEMVDATMITKGTNVPIEAYNEICRIVRNSEDDNKERT